MRQALALLLLTACAEAPSDADKPATPPAEDKCPNVDMDKLAADWIHVQGNKGDHKTRFRIVEQGGALEMWYIGGFFTKLRLAGERRPNDWKFTELPDAAKKARYEAGEVELTRLYVEPQKQKCSLRVSELKLKMKDGKEVEVPKPGFQEYLSFPPGPEFTFRPCDGPLFLGEAAKKAKVADEQLARIGTPDPGHALGEAIPVAAWSDPAADGDAACTFTMDLYFDDRPVEGKQALPAGEIVDGRRQWLVPDWYAPYSGNHHFEMYRYKACGGGERALVAVNCLEAVLQ
jgi:hypothetical protein